MKTSRSVSGFSRQMSESRVLENLLNLQLGAKVKQPGLVPSNLSLGSKLVLNSGPCPSGVCGSSVSLYSKTHSEIPG